jgi:hypothetical protein
MYNHEADAVNDLEESGAVRDIRLVEKEMLRQAEDRVNG